MLLSDNGIDNNDALPRQDAVHISHACCKIGVRATRPRLHQHRLNVGESLVCINIGSTWATRPRLQQHRLNEGESPSFATTSAQRGRVALVCNNIGSMWASRPHSYNPTNHPTVAATSLALSPILFSQNSSMSSCSGAANERGPSGKLNT